MRDKGERRGQERKKKLYKAEKGREIMSEGAEKSGGRRQVKEEKKRRKQGGGHETRP